VKQVEIYCDGSCLGNPGPGGWGAIMRYGKHEKRISGGMAHTTNNQMELIATIEALRLLKEPCTVALYTDSSYVCKGINEWLGGWVAKNFAKVKNPELWQAYIEAAKPHRIRAHWVKGHAGHAENEECDKMAKEMAEKYKYGEL